MISKTEFSQFILQSNDADRVIATLGSEGTSSRKAAEHLADLFPAEIELFPTYELAAASLENSPHHRILLIANAYAKINLFYISEEITPVAAFFFDTPSYVLAVDKRQDAFKKSQIRVASHPALSHMVSRFINKNRYKLVETISTHDAAKKAAQGEVDACLTTDVAASIYNLKILGIAMKSIPMLLWTVFISR